MSSMPVSQRSAQWQHIGPALLVLLLAATVAYLSFTREPADAFLFPRLISSVMLLLALWNAARAVLGLARVGDGLTLTTTINILPGVVIMCVLVFFAAKYFGFYIAALAAFFLLYSGYDPASHLSLRSWIKRALISLLFMAVIYGLFTMLLKVQTPRGLFL